MPAASSSARAAFTFSTSVSLSGSGSLSHSGSGITERTAASNSFSGTVSVTAGTLRLIHTASIGNGAIFIAAGGAFEVVKTASTLFMNKVFSGSGGLVKAGSD